MTVKWEFYDPSGAGTTYEMEINPSSFSMSDTTRSVSNQPTLAGRQMLFQGRSAPVKMSFSGTILVEDEYNVLRQWADQRRQVRLTDDLGREFWIYINSFVPTRQLKVNNPWFFTYNAEATILDWQ
jgi:hypothetical protein